MSQPLIPAGAAASVPLKTALTIATSDSGGGAGIQADLKTFAAHKVFGLCAVSGVTAQNTLTVTGLECLSPSLVQAQLQALYDDVPIQAIKIGLLGEASNTRVVADFLRQKLFQIPVVLDPVMVSTSGHVFLAQEAVEALKDLMSLALVITPNIPEAQVLSGVEISDNGQRLKAAEKIMASGVKNVLIKGGHGQDREANDLLMSPAGPVWFNGPRVNTVNTHGTGCTLSSAIAANLALGSGLEDAIDQAKVYVRRGLENSLNIGHGPGPLNHFHQYYRFES